MDAVTIIAGVDALVKLGTFLNNSLGANSPISAIIGQRLAEGGRDWTPAELQSVTDAVGASKAYAQAQLAQADPLG